LISDSYSHLQDYVYLYCKPPRNVKQVKITNYKPDMKSHQVLLAVFTLMAYTGLVVYIATPRLEREAYKRALTVVDPCLPGEFRSQAIGDQHWVCMGSEWFQMRTEGVLCPHGKEYSPDNGCNVCTCRQDLGGYACTEKFCTK
jgi:hypothetical protein